MSDDDLELFSFRLDEPVDGSEGDATANPSDVTDDGATSDAPPPDAESLLQSLLGEDGAGVTDASPAPTDPDGGDDAFAALAALAGLDPTAAPPADEPTEPSSEQPAEPTPRPLHVDAPLEEDAPWTAAAITDEDEVEEPDAPLLGSSFDRHEPVEDIAAAEDLLDQLLAEAAAADAAAAPPTPEPEPPPEPVASAGPGAPDARAADAVEPEAWSPASDDTDDFSVADDDEDGALAYSLLRRQEPAPPRAPEPEPEPTVEDDPFDGPFTFSLDEDDDDVRPAPGDHATGLPAPSAAASAGRRETTSETAATPAPDDDPLDGPFVFTVDDEDDGPAGAVAPPAAEVRPDPGVRDAPVTDRWRVEDEDPEPQPAAEQVTDLRRVADAADEPEGPSEPPTPLRAGWGTDEHAPERWGLPEDADDPPAAAPDVDAQRTDELDDFADLFEPVGSAEPAPEPAPESGPRAPAARAAPSGPDGLDHLDDLALLFEQVADLDEDPLASAPPPRLEDAIKLDDEDPPREVDPDVARAATEGGFTAGDNARRGRRGLFRR